MFYWLDDIPMEKLRKQYRRERARKAFLRKMAKVIAVGILAGVVLAFITAVESREAMAAAPIEPQEPAGKARVVMATEAGGVSAETAMTVTETAGAIEKVAETESEWECLGMFTLTAYCDCRKCCGKWAGGPTKSGAMPQAGRTIAVDKCVIPLGTRVYIDGYGEFIAEDTGSAIKGNRIDVYMDSHNEARHFANGAGSCKAEVYIIK